MLIKMPFLLIGAKIVLIEKTNVTRSKSFFLVLHNPRTFEDTVVCLYNENKKRMVIYMREKKNHLYVDSNERSILLHSLVELKNQPIQQSRYTDCVDELIFKVIHALIKKLRVGMAGGSGVR